jgi:O-antigen ligase
MGEAAWTVAQYAQGLERPGGSFGHSNTLGIAADFVVFPALALMLGGRRWLLSVAAVFAGGVCALAGGSRASMGLFAVGVLLTTMLSIARTSTSRKFAFGGGMSVLLLLSIPAMIWSANRRSEMATEMSDQARTSMKDAAKMMIADHPFGVGANQYVVVSNMGGYAARAGVAWGGTTRAAPVHDTYYLVTAELGFIGLIGLLAMFASAIGLGFASLRRNLTDESSELVPGLLGAIIIVSLHVAYEFAFMEFMLHYLFAISIAILVAVSARAKSPARNAAGVMVRSGPVTAVG